MELIDAADAAMYRNKGMKKTLTAAVLPDAARVLYPERCRARQTPMVRGASDR